MRGIARAAAIAAGLAAAIGGAPAASAADFYKDKTISIVVGSAAGGSYDAYARLLSRHMGNHIPGTPSVIVRNMPGAAGVQSAQYIYTAAPKDGTSLGAPLNTVPLAQALDRSKIAFDCAALQWIGTAAAPANVLAVWSGTGIKTLADARTREVTIGATTPGTTMEMYPLMANHLFGTKFKVVTGYLGGAEINLAMERGEVEGRGSNSYLSYTFQNAEWIRDKKLTFLFQMTLKRDPIIADVPTLIEFAENDEQRQIVSLLATSEAIGRPVMAPPGVPADRIAILRKALMDAVKDPALRADAAKAKLEIQPISGEDMQKMIESIVHTKPDIVEKYKEAVRSNRS
ncbi:MAG TPA: tripartite tricarboxylate transporter substrate-binding protein [Alphaproteobacteria bacterium]|jgi:tripartite-type tricarboxylate transporter receptor subunit TctC|nr:tripartite tricarboxylate transporter substrate-binding protein [Alphaproteobacteria bacterium]